MPTTTTRQTLEEDPDTWRPLIQASQQWEIQDAGNRLEADGIPTVAQVESFSGSYFEPFYQKHRLFVPENRIEDATTRLEDTAYEKYLMDQSSPLETVSDWRYRDVLLLISGFAIGLVDWVVLYGIYFVEFLRETLTGSD